MPFSWWLIFHKVHEMRLLMQMQRADSMTAQEEQSKRRLAAVVAGSLLTLAVILLIIIVQVFQSVGTRLSVKLDKRLKQNR